MNQPIGCIALTRTCPADVDRSYKNLADTADNASDALAVGSVRAAQAIADVAAIGAAAAVPAVGRPAAVYFGPVAGQAADSGTGDRLTTNLEAEDI